MGSFGADVIKVGQPGQGDDTRKWRPPLKVLGFPAQLSASPATYRYAPPRSGEDTFLVLNDKLGLTQNELDRLAKAGVIAEKL